MEQGLLPKKLGRPQLYTKAEASARKREREREILRIASSRTAFGRPSRNISTYRK